MGKRVYQADDGSIFDSRADLTGYENKIALDAAFDALGIQKPEFVTTDMADGMIAALKPFATRRVRGPRKKATNGAKRSRSAEASAL